MRYIYQKTGPALREAEPAKDRNPEHKDNEFYKIDSQKNRILTWLLDGNTLTAIQALTLFDCWSLAQRIADLRKDGNQIVSQIILARSGKRIAEYSTKSEPDGTTK